MIAVTLVKGEKCDKCKGLETLTNPVLEIYQTTRTDKNIIIVHAGCLSKLIDKARKRDNERPTS